MATKDARSELKSSLLVYRTWSVVASHDVGVALQWWLRNGCSWGRTVQFSAHLCSCALGSSGLLLMAARVECSVQSGDNSATASSTNKPLRWIISKQRNQWHWCHREIVVKLALSTTTNFHRVLCEGYCHLNLQVWSRLQSPDDTINTILPNKGKFLFQNSRKSAPHYPQTRRKMKACRNDCSDLTNCVNKWFFSPSDFKCCEVKLNCCKSFNRNLKMMSALPPRSGESPSRRGGGVSRLAMMQVSLFLPSSAQAQT